MICPVFLLSLLGHVAVVFFFSFLFSFLFFFLLYDTLDEPGLFATVRGCHVFLLFLILLFLFLINSG